MSFVNLLPQSDDSKICVVMVGLPARGKSLIAGKGEFMHWSYGLIYSYSH